MHSKQREEVLPGFINILSILRRRSLKIKLNK